MPDRPLDAGRAAQAGLHQVVALTGKQASGVTSVEPREDGWVVDVEVVEDPRIPSSADVLGLYQADIDADGQLLAYRRTRRYPRSRAEDERS